jgi:endonuclease/exonuclease/phosphatase family metal-dependent hydrolase
MRLATFNAQNLRLRRRDGVEHLDGARDRDSPGESGPVAEGLDGVDRALSARLIAAADADVLALQEVFDLATLDHLCERWLAPLAVAYPERRFLGGNDGHRRNLGVLARVPLDEVHSHAALSFAEVGATPPPGVPASARVFRRDCLAVRVGSLWLFVCHLKAALPGDEVSRVVRRAEALAVRRVIEGHLPDAEAADWIALGDFNAHRPDSEADLAALIDGFAIDLSARIPAGERWTYHQPGPDLYSCPDRLLASPALAARVRTVPVTLWQGMSREASRYTGPRFDEVGVRRPRASDHALVYLDV